MLDLGKIGERIKQLRQKVSLTQEQLADKLYVSRQAVSRWEAGQTLPTIDNICELTVILNASFENILCLDETKTELDFSSEESREAAAAKIARGEYICDIASLLYRFSAKQRLAILKSVKLWLKNGEKAVLDKTDTEELWVKLTPAEQQFLDIEYYKRLIKFPKGTIILRRKKL